MHVLKLLVGLGDKQKRLELLFLSILFLNLCHDWRLTCLRLDRYFDLSIIDSQVLLLSDFDYLTYFLFFILDFNVLLLTHNFAVVLFILTLGFIFLFLQLCQLLH